jgi:hypothetical protein
MENHNVLVYSVYILVLYDELYISPNTFCHQSIVFGRRSKLCHGYEDSPIKALKLDSVNIQLTVMDDSSSIDFGTQTVYDVIVLNDYNLTIAEITALNGWLATEGHG